MQRITGAVAICVQLHKDVVTDCGPQHKTTKGILRRTFTVERCRGDAHRSVLYFDPEGVNPATFAEQVSWDMTRAAWNRLMEIFHGAVCDLNADWVSNNVGFNILLALESVHVLLREVEDVVDVKAPDVPDAA